MDLFETVSRRHCYRGEYEDSPVPETDMKRILTAAIQAPSGCNEETTRFIAILEKPLILKIAGIVEKPKIGTAPAMILLTCASGATYTVEDCAAATQNALLALTALGYVSCWLDGALRHGSRVKQIAELLEIPAPHVPRVLLPVGKPAQPLTPPEKKPFNERVSLNRFERHF